MWNVLLSGNAPNRPTLAQVDTSGFAPGSTAEVADVGDGLPLQYTLQQDPRAADGVLRVTAFNKAGYLWIAGDGVTAYRAYLSPKYDFTQTMVGGFFFGGSVNGSDLLFVPQQGKIVITDFAATAGNPVTTTMSWNTGNDVTKTNVGPSQAVPTAASYNSMITVGVAAPLYNGWNTNASGLKTLNNPVLIDVTIGAAGTNLTTFKGKFYVLGFITALATAQ